jgi:SprB repeat
MMKTIKIYTYLILVLSMLCIQLKSQDFIWNGSISTDWGNGDNWDNSTVPKNKDIVIIPNTVINYPHITDKYKCNQITISQESYIVIEQTGDLSILNDFILESNSDFSASVFNYGTLSIFGDAIFTSTIIPNEWHYISSPISGDIADSLPGMKFKWYEPNSADTLKNGWIYKSGNYTPMEGLDVNLTTDKITYTGTFNDGDYNINISHTTGDSLEGYEGWNLIGNPYPCNINLDLIPDTYKNIMGNAFYIWDGEIQNWATYINGVGANGGTKNIPIGQSFFVKCPYEGTNVVTFTNDIKSIKSSSALKSYVISQLNIQLSGLYYTDETIIKFSSSATKEYDMVSDGLKRFTNNIFVPQIYTVTSDNKKLVINTLPISEEHFEIPLYFDLNFPDEFVLNFNGLTELNLIPLYLEDILKDTIINLNISPEYKFDCFFDLDINNRFILHYNKPITIETEISNVSCVGNNDGMINIITKGGISPHTFQWSNGSTDNKIESLSAGEYIVTITDGKDVIVEKIIITEPDSIKYKYYLIKPSKSTTKDGSIVLSCDDSYIIEWSTGDIGKYLFNVTEGNYYFEITDHYNCKITENIQLKSNELIKLNNNNYNSGLIEVIIKNEIILMNIISPEQGDIYIYNISGQLINKEHYSVPGSYLFTTTYTLCLIMIVSNNEVYYSKILKTN